MFFVFEEIKMKLYNKPSNYSKHKVCLGSYLQIQEYKIQLTKHNNTSI